jgi:L-methionine (R)-S-oxide reductase
MPTTNDTAFIAKFIGASRLMEGHTDLAKGLTELAATTARMLEADKCSIMLLQEEQGKEGPGLRTYAHYGDLPEAALRQITHFDQGIAGRVAASGKPLLLQNIACSDYAADARRRGHHSKTLMSTPICLAGKVVGVINVTDPSDARVFKPHDLDLLEILAAIVGKSIHIVQLQNILESRFLQMALYREMDHRPTSAPPDPGRLAKIVAKTIYRELTSAGFGPNQIIGVTSEVIDLLQQNLQRHKKRREREQHAADSDAVAA